jgi:hypothetical protein
MINHVEGEAPFLYSQNILFIGRVGVPEAFRCLFFVVRLPGEDSAWATGLDFLLLPPTRSLEEFANHLVPLGPMAKRELRVDFIADPSSLLQLFNVSFGLEVSNDLSDSSLRDANRH